MPILPDKKPDQKSNKKLLGDIAEDKALEFLSQQGLKLIDSNFYCRFGEIDLIMQDQDYLVFIEVRSRKNMGFGNALESITLSKQTKLRKAADYFFLTKTQYKKVAARFDVILIPPTLTNTADNGPEFTKYEKVTKEIGMRFYFANPYSSWERGTNENGNGLIRRFFPKKTDFNKVSAAQIKAVEDWINHRPMKCCTPTLIIFMHLIRESFTSFFIPSFFQ